MELKDFIKKTLIDIASGVHEANKEFKTATDSTDYFEVQAHGEKDENYIIFDVAVSSSGKDSLEGKGGLGS